MCAQSDDNMRCEETLWAIACKVRAIGELIKNREGDPSLDEEEVNFGIGEILTDIAHRIRALSH